MTFLMIGVPTYRGAERLERLLDSLREAVTEQDVRVLVVDDGSPRDEQKKVGRIAVTYGVDFVGYEENLGAYHAYNVIAGNSTSEYVCFLDDDVIIPKWWLESLLFFVANNRFAVASWKSTRYYYEPTQPIGSSKKPERATELAGYCFCFPRRLWNEHRFDEEYRCFIADSDFCVYWASKGLPSYRILWPLVYHMEHATYDSCPELEHERWREHDIARFVEKWGASPREMEAKLLRRLKPQQIRWLTAEGPQEAWDG